MQGSLSPYIAVNTDCKLAWRAALMVTKPSYRAMKFGTDENINTVAYRELYILKLRSVCEIVLSDIVKVYLRCMRSQSETE